MPLPRDLGKPTQGANRCEPQPAPQIAALFASPISAFLLDGPGNPDQLTDEEAVAVLGASQGRREQFAAGRSCARAGLAELGVPTASLPRGEDRRPLWPAGTTGSLSHASGRCVAVVGRLSDSEAPRPGIDVERLGRIDFALATRLFSETELDEARGIGSLRGIDRWFTAGFGAKEAFYKAQFDLTGAWVGFHDVTVTWTTDRNDVWQGLLVPAVHPADCLRGDSSGGAPLHLLRWPVEVSALFDDDHVVVAAMVAPITPASSDECF